MLTFILARLGPAAEARFLGLVTTGETHAKPPVNGQRRRDAHKAPIVIPKARPRRPITVYECDSCGERALGEQRCETCSTRYTGSSSTKAVHRQISATRQRAQTCRAWPIWSTEPYNKPGSRPRHAAKRCQGGRWWGCSGVCSRADMMTLAVGMANASFQRGAPPSGAGYT
jgi:hypothetical protein